MKIVVVQSEDDHASDYGIGTFLNEYLDCLKQISFVKIFLMKLYTKRSEFEISERAGIVELCFPYLEGALLRQDTYFIEVFTIARLYIKDDDDIIFSFQSPSHFQLIERINKFFPTSKIVFTIHYMHGISSLMGCVQAYNERLVKKYSDTVSIHNDYKQIFDLSDMIVCLSNDTYKLLKQYFSIPVCKLVLIPNGLKDSYKILSQKQKYILRNYLFVGKYEKIILFVGRVTKIKGITSLLTCFNLVVKKFPNCRLVIIGDIQNWRVINNREMIGPEVLFAGWLSFYELRKWYQIADIGVVSSYYEESSCVGIEMMMHGLPVVASDGYSVTNMFHDGENALVAKIGDIRHPNEFEANLAEALLRLLRSDDLRESLGRKSRAYYLSHYRAEIMRERYHAFFKDLSLTY